MTSHINDDVMQGGLFQLNDVIFELNTLNLNLNSVTPLRAASNEPNWCHQNDFLLLIYYFSIEIIIHMQ